MLLLGGDWYWTWCLWAKGSGATGVGYAGAAGVGYAGAAGAVEGPAYDGGGMKNLDTGS
jgi:hypothetical protein